MNPVSEAVEVPEKAPWHNMSAAMRSTGTATHSGWLVEHVDITCDGYEAACPKARLIRSHWSRL